MRGLFPTTIAAAIALACGSSIVLAQETTSSIRGSISTDAGDGITGATVTIVHTPSGTTSTVTTGNGGAFSAPGLRPGGPYTITVAASGYGDTKLDGVYLGVGEPLNVPVTMASAEQELDEVVVSGQAVALTAGPSSTYNRETIEGVASVQRDVRDIARRDPMASFNPTRRGVQIAGTNNRTNRFAVDGLNFSDSFGLNQGGMPTTRGPVPLDAVEQMSVKVAPYDITEGDFQGGSINVVLRSGGNDLSGSAFYTYTDDQLTGDKAQDIPVNLDFSSKNWGAFLSGPIVRNKLFFALAYEDLDQGDPASIGLAGSPDPITSITDAQVANVSSIASSVYSYDTLGLRTVLPETDKKYTAKLDWNINDFHRLSYTGIFQKTYQQSPSSGSKGTVNSPALYYQAYATNEPEKVNSSALQLNSQWSSAFSTEARINFRNYSKIPSSLGTAGFPEVQVCLDAANTGPAFTCSLNNTGRLYFGVERFSQADVVKAEQKGAELVARYNIGNHALKAQAAYSDVEITNVFVQGALGVYYFDSIAAFQSRNASQLTAWQYSITGDLADAAASFGYNQFTLGVQDSWNVLPGLNVTYGARVDAYKSGDEPPLNTNFNTRYGFANTTTIDGNSVIQPRVGVTWRPPVQGLTLRGGFGLFSGGSPAVFLGNSFSAAGVYGNTLSNITRTATGCTLGTAATSPVLPANVCAAALDSVGTSALRDRAPLFNYLSTNTASLAAAVVNAMEPGFDLPSTWKANLSADYSANLGPLGMGWKFGADLYQTWVQDAALYTDLRLTQVGTAPDGRPIYADTFTNTTNYDMLMSNTGKGKSSIWVARLNKEWGTGFSGGVSYAHQSVKSLSDMGGSTYAEGGTTGNGTYGAQPMVDPNRPAYGRSIYEIEHNYKFSLGYEKALFGDFKSRISLFSELRSGTPYSLTMVSSGGRSMFGTIQSTNTTDRRYLLYVPNVTSITADPKVSYANQATFDALRAIVLQRGLEQGTVIGKNTETAPQYFKVDLHLEQEVPFFAGSRFSVFADVENLLNLFDSDEGSFRYYDSLVPLVSVACAVTSGASCTQYRYSAYTAPQLRRDGRIGVWSARLGFRMSF